MPRDARAYLSDLIESCDAIAVAVRGLDLGGYEGSRLVRSSVEREFIIIGEAAAALARIAPEAFGAITRARRKGIILTTGTFTAEARREAVRDGVPPIELVDGEKLLDLFEKLELGLKPRTAYEIDDGFFEDFTS